MAKLAIITEGLRSLRLTFAELAPPEFFNSFAVGAAVRWESDDFVMISVPLGSEVEAYITGGVLWDVSQNDKLTLLEVCNDLTADVTTPACYLHDGEDIGGSILRQLKFPVPIVRDVPPFFEALVREMSPGVHQAREAFAERGIVGRPWTWDAESLKRLLIKSVF